MKRPHILLAVVPVHIATQLRIAEAMERRDVLEDGGVWLRRAIVMDVLVHGMVGMW